MIFIKNITIENFQGIADRSTFDFEEKGLFTIKGANGVGKSTILDAIYTCLFGETTRADKLVDVINLQNKNNECYLELNLVSYEDLLNIKIIRTISIDKSNKAYMLIDSDGRGYEITQHTVIVEELKKFGFDKRFFSFSSILPQNSINMFIESDKKQLGEFLEAITDTSKIKEVKEKLTEEFSELNGEVAYKKKLMTNLEGKDISEMKRSIASSILAKTKSRDEIIKIKSEKEKEGRGIRGILFELFIKRDKIINKLKSEETNKNLNSSLDLVKKEIDDCNIILGELNKTLDSVLVKLSEKIYPLSTIHQFKTYYNEEKNKFENYNNKKIEFNKRKEILNESIARLNLWKKENEENIKNHSDLTKQIDDISCSDGFFKVDEIINILSSFTNTRKCPICYGDLSIHEKIESLKEIKLKNEKYNEIKYKINLIKNNIEEKNDKINYLSITINNKENEIKEMEKDIDLNKKNDFDNLNKIYIIVCDLEEKFNNIQKDIEMTIAKKNIKQENLNFILKELDSRPKDKFNIEDLELELERCNININSFQTNGKELDVEINNLSETLLRLQMELQTLEYENKKLNDEVEQYNSLKTGIIEKEESLAVLQKLLAILSEAKFPRFIKSMMLESIVTETNEVLGELSDGRYKLLIDEKLNILVEDADIPGSIRNIGLLSGAEKTKVSLALAFTISSILSESGFIFLDESLGALNKENLQTVYKTFEDFADATGKQIGVISHDEAFLELFNSVLKLEENGKHTWTD